MKNIVRIFAFLLLATAATFGAVAAHQGEPETPPSNASISDLMDGDGNLLGYAVVYQDDLGATGVSVVARGLTPGSHGIHVHEAGNCDPAGEKTFEQAGGHFNPGKGVHGMHAGDLGNLIADEDGEAVFSITGTSFDLSEAGSTLRDTDGSALVIHADVDDLVTDPSGNSGARFACAVLFSPQ
jgi:Cu-Zn family superoxide dismutase